MLVWWLNGWLEVDHHHVIEFEGPQASYKTGRCNFVIGEERVWSEKKNLVSRLRLGLGTWNWKFFNIQISKVLRHKPLDIVSVIFYFLIKLSCGNCATEIRYAFSMLLVFFLKEKQSKCVLWYKEFFFFKKKIFNAKWCQNCIKF